MKWYGECKTHGIGRTHLIHTTFVLAPIGIESREYFPLMSRDLDLLW